MKRDARVFKFVLCLLLVGSLAVSLRAKADDEDGDDLKIIELELEKSVPTKPPPTATKEKPKPEAQKPEASDLTSVTPFSETSVLQKKALPKSGRFQLFGGLSLTTNDPFFNTTGVTGKVTYHITEQWGVEAQYYTLSSSQTKATTDLLNIQNISASNIAYTKSYMGLSLQYVPFYGKIAWDNKTIIPFDIFFGLGGGITATDTSTGITTTQVEVGQLFGVSKSLAVRWDFSWNFFSAQSIGSSGNINNLLFSAGISWFIPEASYR